MEKTCEYCGKAFTVKRARMQRAKYCSYQCHNDARRGRSFSTATQFTKGFTPWNYNGGRTKSKGYVLVKRPDHQRANPNGYVSEHILVWEEANGQPLPQDWVVHHYNGIKHDNRPENLIGMPRRAHHPALDPGLIKERLREIETELADLREKYEALLRAQRDTN